MKSKCIAYEMVYGSSDGASVVRRPVKKFKKEPDAIAFVEDDRNICRYINLTQIKTDESGVNREWDSQTQRWVAAQEV